MERTTTSGLINRGLFPFNSGNRILYKYVSFETAKLILANLSLKFSNPLDFNDPFELNTNLIDLSSDLETFKYWVNYQKVDLKTKESLIEWYQNDPQDTTDELFRVFENSRNKIGICCFSELYHNPLMWSHYGDKHFGVCIGFQFDPNDSIEDVEFMKVKYIDYIKPINFFKERAYFSYEWICTKSMDWNYEMEIRAILPNSPEFVCIPSNCIRQIYFGLRCSHRNVNEIKSIILEKGLREVSLKYMHMDKIRMRLIDDALPPTAHKPNAGFWK